VFAEEVGGFFSVRSGFVGHNIVNPTTSRDNPQEQAASVRSTLATTLNATQNKQPDVASERQVDIPE
jgi:hypothetical protein